MALFGSANSRPAAHRRSNRPSVSKSAEKAKTSGLNSWLQGLDWGVVRIRLVAVFFVIAWGALWVRAAKVQLVDGPYLSEMARRQHMSSEMVDTPRGMITDRNGRILARSVECRSVYVNPRQITDVDATAATLAELLNLPLESVHGTISKNKRFAWVARRVDDATAEAVRRAALPGVELAREYERIYPYKQVAGQLLGFVGLDGHGLEGVERAFEQTLAGGAARQYVQRDARGRRYYVAGENNTPTAENVNLTLDVQVQFIAEDVLARTVEATQAKWGGVLIVEVESGDVLAWAQHPFFNPNAYRNYSPAVYRNRLALDALEPGSIFKPFLVASALQEGLISRDTVVDCEGGTWRSRTITIRDDGRSYGELPVHRVISLSSNIGCAKIGLMLGPAKFHKYLTELGFGQTTDLAVNQARGILRAPRDWSEADVISSSFGQSLSVTAVQMAQGYLTLANAGQHMPLNLTTNTNLRLSPSGQRIFSAATSREVLRMLRETVEEGTGKNAAIPGISVAGKTGTAQKADKSGKYGSARMASFVGMTPADSPRYLVVIMLDELARNKYGGALAAPVFREVASRMLAYYGELPDAGAVRVAEAKNGKTKKQAERRSGKNASKKATSADKPMALVDGEFRHSLAGEPKVLTSGGQVPDVTGQTVRRAVEMFARQGLVPVIRGVGPHVVRQEPAPGAAIADTSADNCILWLQVMPGQTLSEQVMPISEN